MSEIIVPIKGLSSGTGDFDFAVDEEFTGGFSKENGILDADCKVHVHLERHPQWMKVDLAINGFATVECDRCLDELELPVAADEHLTVRFAKEAAESEDDNVLIVSEDDADLDLSQCVYDFICLSLPMQRVHPDGECNPDMVSRLSDKEGATGDECEENTPFKDLGELLRNKNK